MNNDIGIYLVPTPYPTQLPLRAASPEELWHYARELKNSLHSCNLDKGDANAIYQTYLSLPAGD